MDILCFLLPFYQQEAYDMDPSSDFDFIIRRLERLSHRMSLLRLEAYLQHAGNWKKRFFFDFLSGIARGLGFSIGFSILGALVLYILRNVALANLPVIGRFLAELVRIVETNL